jgi:hypothetical protein
MDKVMKRALWQLHNPHMNAALTGHPLLSCLFPHKLAHERPHHLGIE